MATPFPFTAGQVLTAAQLNAITELVVNDKTDSYTLVAGDAGEYVVMNKATATTITVPNSVFTTSQIVRIINKGAGTCTVTAGAGTTVSSTGSLALAQNATGMLIALSSSAFIFQAGGVTATASGLTYITGASFSAVSSVSLAANTFTSTYRNYKIVLHVTSASADMTGTMRLRAGGTDDTSAAYLSGGVQVSNGGATVTFSGNNATSWNIMDANSAQGGSMSMDLIAPQLSARTFMNGTIGDSDATYNLKGGAAGYVFGNTTSFDACTFLFSATSTGIYRVYGYADS